MSRVQRASIAATFAYAQFALSIAVGILMVPFVLERVGVRLYGYWLASGEVLAYAAMADLGVLGVLPWLIAQADGRGDRGEIRRLLSAGFCTALLVSAAYLGIVVVLWQLAPTVLKLGPAERDLIAGPLALMAGVTAVVLPMRVAYSALLGLQDVRYCGIMRTAVWALDAVLTVTLLFKGYGLWALAIGASVASCIDAGAALVRLRLVAPDLLSGWRRPSIRTMGVLLREGSGGWLGAWGWRLTAATDGIVIAALGQPVWITVLAMTSKLGQMLTNMAWVPGDSGLVGLANLSGEQKRERLRAAIAALSRVYLTLGSAAACVVLAANPGFVRGWVGEDLFGGLRLNALIALGVLGSTAAHAASCTIAVLGRRLYVGIVALVGGVAHVALAYVLGRQLGLIGIPLAAVLVQLGILVPALLPALRTVAPFGLRDVMTQVVAPWTARALPVLAAAGLAGVAFREAPLWAAIPLGGAAGAVMLYVARQLILDYPPVAALVRQRLALLKLDTLLLRERPQRPGA